MWIAAESSSVSCRRRYGVPSGGSSVANCRRSPRRVDTVEPAAACQKEVKESPRPAGWSRKAVSHWISIVRSYSSGPIRSLGL